MILFYGPGRIGRIAGPEVLEGGLMFHKGFASATLGVTALTLALGLLGLTVSPAAAITFTDSGFASETVTTLPPYTPIGLTFAPDGCMFIRPEARGGRIFNNGALLPTPFIDI